MLQYSGVTGIGDSVTSEGGNTSSPAAGTLSPAPGANDLVVRFYIFIGASNSTTLSTSTNPGGTWTNRMNVRTTNSGYENTAISANEKLQGTDDQTCTSGQSGTWGVVDISLLGTAAVGGPNFNFIRQPNRQARQRASRW